MAAMTEEQKNLAKEAAEIESLIYDDICNEIHELGIEFCNEQRYGKNADAVERIIEQTCNELYERFHTEYPKYSRRAFGKVFYFCIKEGKDLAYEQDYAC